MRLQSAYLTIIILFLAKNVIAAPQIEREVVLSANINSSKSAIEQIKHVFGEKSIESPCQYPEHNIKEPRIVVNKDKYVSGCFKFFLLRDKDGDRTKSREKSDRQRNEIKGYDRSNEALKAAHGQVTRYQWKFRIDSDLKVTHQFCHLFQLKGYGGKKVKDPIFTLSAALSKTTPILELRHWKNQGSSETKYPLTKLSPIKNKWIICDLIVDYRESGAFELKLYSLKGKVLASVSKDNINTWRDNMEFCRPKWGIYRSIKRDVNKMNPEDSVSFADFIIQEWSEWPKVNSKDLFVRK